MLLLLWNEPATEERLVKGRWMLPLLEMNGSGSQEVVLRVVDHHRSPATSLELEGEGRSIVQRGGAGEGHQLWLWRWGETK